MNWSLCTSAVFLYIALYNTLAALFLYVLSYKALGMEYDFINIRYLVSG